MAEKKKKIEKKRGNIDSVYQKFSGGMNMAMGGDEFYEYFLENKEGLIDYRKRGLEIQPTRSKEIHHANLGSMESNIFTLIGNRMKGKRMSWSVNGGNNMAALLCLLHTGRMDRLFNNSAEWHPQ